MSNLPATENLDERIERIRKRDEELEKKYREAEEDRLNALKDNAMVRTGVIKDEDWPRAHKYDKLDFTYDQKPEPALPESETITNLLPNEKPGLKTGRDYKKFADGQGPPADPTYNFLADSERDGSTPVKTENKIHDKKDWRNPNNRGSNRGNNRGRGGRGRNDGRSNYHGAGEYDAWKNERTIYDEARINRQKSNDGKWRREWDSEKFPEEENALKMEKISLDDSKSPEHKIARPIIQDGPVSRGNITVSITNDGEVKSVKLLSPPAIGSGRVGPRQVTKPHFAVQINNEIDGQNNKKFSGNNNYQQKKDFNKKLPVQGNREGNGFNNKPFPPKTTNIQDRLNRNRQPLPLKSSDENNGSPIVVNY